ncbi:imelysin family protein [Isorropodon fossajaponicum symbiont]|uniref:imelysin family protein n=1 Tax=Isorropodon fossajaponicum symbiont TaxID=883811 RepID=UPI001CED1325|nr:imelysin family protein [Isorropodon fossajaponicum symbiont]
MAVVFLLVSVGVNAVGEKFFNQVIIVNAVSAIKNAELLIDSINQSNQTVVKRQFGNLVSSWKKVETTYLLGDLNEDYLDTPRYIDIFHGNNENIKSQLDLINNNNDVLSSAMYKHLHKTINALEYILFTKDLSHQRVKNMALMITRSIKNYLSEILNGYKAHQSKFPESEQYASAILLNTLVDGTYKLKEWRIGDVASLSKKFKNRPNNHRAEYAISGNSMNAIKAILAAQVQVINSPDYQDFGDIARQFKAIKEINQAISALNDSIANANDMSEFDFINNKGRRLYQSTNRLMQAYYISLMDRLGFVSKVLDADGD